MVLLRLSRRTIAGGLSGTRVGYATISGRIASSAAVQRLLATTVERERIPRECERTFRRQRGTPAASTPFALISSRFNYVLPSILQMSDWYQVSRRDIENHGGSGMFYTYSGMAEVLASAYPDHQWDSEALLSLTRVPGGHWRSDEHMQQAMEKAEKQLGIQKVRECEYEGLF